MRRAFVAGLLACVLAPVLPAAGGVGGFQNVRWRGGDPATVRAVLDPFSEAGNLRIETERRSPIGRHLRGRQYRDGVPIDGTWIAVHMWEGKVRRADLRVTDLSGAPTADPVSPAVATEAATAHLALSPADVLNHRLERLLVARGGRLRDVRRVHLLGGGGAWKVDVDAGTGQVLMVRRGAVFQTPPTATVFDPNPVVTLQDPELRQPGVDVAGIDTDLDDPRLTDALTSLAMREVDQGALAEGRLLGPWVDVQGPGPMTMSGNAFEYTRSDPRFEAAMAYAHLDRLQRHFRILGFTSVNAEPQLVYALPLEGFDNSLYASGFDAIVLGAGGVDDGEDAEVIVHEYGHAVHDDQVPGWGQSEDASAMGEGWGDFLAAAFYARTSSDGFQDTCVADWDATSYSDDDPPCLRRLDTDKRYPEDASGEAHSDGEIWSAFLWDLRAKLGTTQAERSDNALRLVLASHELLAPDATFSDAVEALEVAAKNLGRTDWVPHIHSTAQERGFAP